MQQLSFHNVIATGHVPGTMTISVTVSLAHGVIRVARQIIECGVRITHWNLQTFLAFRGTYTGRL